MARNLHQLDHGDPTVRTAGLATCLIVAVVGLLVGGCGPVEPEQPEPGPPHIGQVTPSEPVYQVRGETTEVTLRANQLYDPNREAALYALWFSSSQGYIGDSTINLPDGNPEVQYRGATFFQYGEVEQTVDPCASSELGTRGRETIWLYVSDRSFPSTTNDSFEVADSAFLVSHSWVLDYVCR